MGLKVKDASLQNRESRRALKVRNEPYWRAISQGLHVGYRKGTLKRAWLVRRFTDGKYVWRTVGEVDDVLDADGKEVLNWAQAQEAAQAFDKDLKVSQGIIRKPLTVEEASDRYLKWFREHRKGVTATESVVQAHILPTLGNKLLTDLTTPALKEWLGKVASTPARLRSGKSTKRANYRPAAKTADEKRARRSTANRILTVLKAILNKAYADGYTTTNTVWSKVKPYEKVDQARIRFLTDAEALRLVNACPLDLRSLIRGALLTGARRGELAALKVADVNLRIAQIYIAESKSGKPRHIPLNPEGLEHFKQAVIGKTGDELVFTRKDGAVWAHNDHVRALKVACDVAKVKPMAKFIELRHTYASMLINNGVDLPVISKLLGHADARITYRHYAHLADKTLAVAVTKLPSFQTKPGTMLSSIHAAR